MVVTGTYGVVDLYGQCSEVTITNGVLDNRTAVSLFPSLPAGNLQYSIILMCCHNAKVCVLRWLGRLTSISFSVWSPC